jgi:hypothetical protein
VTARPAWALWSLQRSDGSGLQVDEGAKADMGASARLRNGTAERNGLAHTMAFVALPYGRQPTMTDLPPLPESSSAPAAQPRTLMSVQNDLAALFDPNSTTLGHFRPTRARFLAEEAFQLGKAEQAAEHRKALGKAWSAALDGIPDEFWKFLPYDDPELYRRWRAFLLGGRDA